MISAMGYQSLHAPVGYHSLKTVSVVVEVLSQFYLFPYGGLCCHHYTKIKLYQRTDSDNSRYCAYVRHRG